MKFTDAPQDVQKRLLRLRMIGNRKLMMPDDGELWWPPSVRCCQMCGCDRSRLVVDHCHVSGLIRGSLCYDCNSAEWRHTTPEWEFWRFNAPGLDIDNREFYQNSWTGSAAPVYLTHDEVFTLPIADLLALSAERYDSVVRQWDQPTAEHLARILDEPPVICSTCKGTGVLRPRTEQRPDRVAS